MAAPGFFLKLAPAVPRGKVLASLSLLLLLVLLLPFTAEAKQATVTTLTVLPNPATAGQVVTLTGAVTSGGNPVTAGTVTFLSGKQVLGTVQLVQGGAELGMATLKTRFAPDNPGPYTLTAQYNGTNAFQPSQSQPQQLTVTGTEPTITTLTAKPDGNNYDFTASVFGFGFPAPTGTASFTDLTTMTNLGSVGIVGPGTLGFQLPAPFPTGDLLQYIASGDFNGDGFPDLAVPNTRANDTTVSVLLGNGDGTFQAPQTFQVGLGPFGIAVADFNGDGRLDIAVSDYDSFQVSVLLGNGDGTFQPQQIYPVPDGSLVIAVGDFNGDGAPDLVIAPVVAGVSTVVVLLNNGDGTFTKQQQTPFPTGTVPTGLVVGDFNHDGFLDVAVASQGINSVSVLLGNGDGTFQPQQQYSVGTAPLSIVAADFNGDGSLDLAVINELDSTVSVLLGNGDGTFQPQKTYPVGTTPYGIAVADFNGDGLLDLAVNNFGDFTVSVLLGKGDGTFQPQLIYPAGDGPTGNTVADFNGDGVPDIAANDFGTSTVGILLGGTVTTGQLLNTPVIGANQTIQSTYTPNLGFYTGSLSNQVIVSGGGQIATMTTVALTMGNDPSSYGQPLAFTATVTAVGGGSPTGTVTFTDNGANLSGCVALPLMAIQNGSTATCQTSTLIVGAHMIVGTYSGDQNFTSSESLPFSQVVNKAATVFSHLTPSQSVTYGTPSITLSGTICSPGGVCPPVGEHVTITIQGQPPQTAKVSDNTGDFSTPYPTGAIPAGIYTITYSYAGDGNFLAAADSSTTLTVNQAVTTTVLTSSLNPSQYNGLVVFTATVTAVGGGSPTGTVNFTADGIVIAGCAAVQLVPQPNGSTAMCQTSTLTVGSHTIVATYSGDQNFLASNGALIELVNKADTQTALLADPPSPSNYLQLVTFAAIVTGSFGGSPSGTVTFTTDGTNPICTNVPLAPLQNGSIARCLTADLPVGIYPEITATYNDDANYNGSSGILPYQVLGSATVTTLSVTPASPVVAGQVVTLAATVSANGEPLPNGGTVTFFSGKQSLGTAQLVFSIGGAPVGSGSGHGARRNRPAPSLGTGTLLTRFAPGTYTITAQFNPILLLEPSVSAPQQLTVTGNEPTITTLIAQPDGLNYDFTASVFGFGFPAPTGTATFNDLTTMTSLGSAAIVGPGMSTFQPQQTYATGLKPAGVAVGDFNGDGFPDLAIVNQNDSTVGVLLGNGDGTFQPQKTYAVGTLPVGVAVDDFNGDGIPDLAVTNRDQTISVLLGKGDGTFLAQQTSAADQGAYGIALGDFNGDGIPDLAVTNNDFEVPTVTVLLGIGDGFFQQNAFLQTGSSPAGVVVADFNGDGVLDLATSNRVDNTVSVLLGNGDGSFRLRQTYQVGNSPLSIAVGDFNRDGVPDLAVANQGDNTVSVLLGKGDGTFLLQQTYAVGTGPSGVAVADFNGDGFADLVITNGGSNNVSVLLGNGNGTFQTQQQYDAGNNPGGVAVADFNGDGVPDVAAVDNGANSASILLGGTVAAGTLLNIPVVGGGDFHDIQSTYASNLSADHKRFAPAGGFYTGSESNIVPVKPRPPGGPTTTVLTSSLNPSEVNQAVTFKATVTAQGQLPTGNVTFTSNGKPIPECPNPIPVVPMGNASVASCTTQSLAAGLDGVLAIFNDSNGLFRTSFDALGQTVQDFSLLPITPDAVTVTQGFNNTNQPFFAQNIYMAAQPLFGYSGVVTLSCSVNPALVNGSCMVNPPSSGSLAAGDLATTLVISAGSTTPIGSYTVTVTAQDNTGVLRSETLALTVIDYTPGITMLPGGAGTTDGTLTGPPGTVVGNLSCPLVTGTGITGSEPLSKIGGVCTFSQGMVTLPGTFTVTISGCTVARLGTSPRIFATLWLGLPAMVLLGSWRIRRLPRKKVLQVVATLLLLLTLLMGVGCGGGYGQLSPTGMYSVLVQGTGPDGTKYYAVVPVTVTPLK